MQLVAFLAVGGIGDERGSVGHFHLDLVIIGMVGVFLHDGCSLI